MFNKLFIILILFIFITNSAFASDDFNDYLKQLKRQVDRTWNAPVYYQRHTSDVYFKVNKDGSISDIKLYKTSKVPQLDKKAVSAIKNMNKLDKLPTFYLPDYIEIVVGLTNYIYEDMRNPNIYQKKKNIKQNNTMPVSTKCVRIKKVIYGQNFSGESNYLDKMKKLELNLKIQKAMRN